MSEKRAPTKRDIDVLGELAGACTLAADLGLDGWMRPMDCGGRDGSDHSYRLTRLVAFDFAESKRLDGFGPRGSKRYRITAAGRLALSKARGET